MMKFFGSLVLGYPAAAALFSNVSMTFSATVWTSAWTYLQIFAGMLFGHLLMEVTFIIFVFFFMPKKPSFRVKQRPFMRHVNKYNWR